MGLERVKAKFPNGVIRTQHPFYMADAIHDIPGCLEACLSSQLLDPLKEVLGGFKPARIFTIGCGTSYNAAQAAAYTLRTLLGITAAAFDAYDFELDLPAGVNREALVISISQSGGSLTSCLAQEKARSLGALTIGITGKPDSRLATGADFALTDPYLLEVPLGKTRSYLSSALLGMLAGVMTADAEVRFKFVNQAKAMVAAIRENMQQWEDAGRKTGSEWAALTNRYMLTGFGVQQPNTDEMALKLIEVIAESAAGFALEEFMHGTNASFHKDMGIFLFQTDERVLEKSMRIAQGVAQSQAPLVILTDRVDAGWPQKAWKISLPHLDNMKHLGIFPAAVAAQFLLYYLAIAKGLNPDINGNDIRPEMGDIYAFFFPPGTH